MPCKQIITYSQFPLAKTMGPVTVLNENHFGKVIRGQGLAQAHRRTIELLQAA